MTTLESVRLQEICSIIGKGRKIVSFFVRVETVLSKGVEYPRV